jgi:hypothetical protein
MRNIAGKRLTYTDLIGTEVAISHTRPRQGRGKRKD